jgi:hypothetical protein
MKKLSDQYLRSVFQQRFKDHQAEPDVTAWASLEEKLPKPSGRIMSAKSRGMGIFILAIVLLVITGIVGDYVTSPEVTANLKGELKPSPTESLPLNDLPLNPDQSTQSTEHDKISHDENFQSTTKPINYNTAISSRESKANAVNSSSTKEAIHLNQVIQESKQSTAGNTVNVLNAKPSNSISGNYEATLNTNQVVILIDEAMDQVSGHENLSTQFNLTKGALTLPEAKQLSADSIKKGNEVQGATSLIPAIDSADLVYKEREQKNNWRLIINPFYSTVTFSPLKYDNVQVRSFNQSANVFENRLGVAISVGYHHNLSKKLKLEYAAGYRVLFKNFTYSYALVEDERILPPTTKNISGAHHSTFISVMGKSVLLGQPVLLSVCYNYSLGGPLLPYLGRHQIYYGAGLERSINQRSLVRVTIQYGIPIGNGIEHFKMQPTLWSLHMVRKLK